MKRQFSILLHLFYPAGIGSLWCNQTQSLSNVQPYHNAVALTARENKQE